MKSTNFRNDFSYGTLREKEFSDLFSSLLHNAEKDMPDVVHWAGATFEMKCETRSSLNTPNFAVETIKNLNTGAPGGPWQSTAMYIVFFFGNDDFFIFSREDFAQRAEELIEAGVGFYSDTPNSTYFTRNQILPRARFKDLEIDWRRFAD